MENVWFWFSGGAEWSPFPPACQTGNHQRAARVRIMSSFWMRLNLLVSIFFLLCNLVLCNQVSERPGVVGDRRPLPAEAFPGSSVPPGDGGGDAVDWPQPHCLLPQQSQWKLLFCNSAAEYVVICVVNSTVVKCVSKLPINLMILLRGDNESVTKTV